METLLKCRVVLRYVGHDESHAGTQDAAVGAVEEEGNANALLSQSVSVGAINAFNQSMQAQSSQMIGHAARGHLFGWFPEKCSEMAAQVAIAKPVGQQSKHQEETEKCLDSWIGVAQGGSPLAVDLDRTVQLLERIFADRAIMAE